MSIPITFERSEYPGQNEEGNSCCQVTLTLTDCKITVEKTPYGIVIFVADPSVVLTSVHLKESKGNEASKHNLLKVKESRVKVNVTLLRSGEPGTVHNVDGIVKNRAEVTRNHTKNMSDTDVKSTLTLILDEPSLNADLGKTILVHCSGRGFDHLLVDNHSAQSHDLSLVDGKGGNSGNHKNFDPDVTTDKVSLVLLIEEVDKHHQ